MNYRFNYSNFVIKDGIAYFTLNSYNGIFSMDIENGVIELIGRCENEPCNKQNLFHIGAYQNLLLLIPNSAHMFVTYDLITKEIKEIEISRHNSNDSSGVSNWIVHNRFLYLFPGTNRTIKVIDLDKMELNYEADISEIYYQQFKEKYSYFAPRYCCNIHNEKIYLPCYGEKAIMEYDISKRAIKFICLEDVLPYSVYSLITIADDLVILDEAGFFYKLKNHELIKLNQNCLSDIEEMKAGDFLKILKSDSYLFIISSNIMYSKIVNIVTWEENGLLDLDNMNAISDSVDNIDSIRLMGNIKNNLYFISGNEKIICVDAINKRIKSICDASYNKDMIEKKIKTVTNQERVRDFNENDLFNLKDFVIDFIG